MVSKIFHFIIVEVKLDIVKLDQNSDLLALLSSMKSLGQAFQEKYESTMETLSLSPTYPHKGICRNV